MCGRLPIVVALAALIALFAMPMPAGAQPDATPTADPNAPARFGLAVADAGAGLSIVRVLPSSAPPGAATQATGDVGIGLATVRADANAAQSDQRVMAESAPIGVAGSPSPRRMPATLTQLAPPDNALPTTGELTPPPSPLDSALRMGPLHGSVQARWETTRGLCVDPIADAQTSLASLSAVNAIPSLPSTPDLSGLLPPSTPKLDRAAVQGLIGGVTRLAGPLNQLGGLLSPRPGAEPGSLLRLPDTISARSTVRLVDVDGLAGRAVRATSTVALASITLLPGTPQELRIDVVSPPTLVATATGDEKTSLISYQTSVLRVSQGNAVIGQLDANNPALDVPISVALPGGGQPAPALPIVGGLLAGGAPAPADINKLDIAVLRLRTGELDTTREPVNEAGKQIGYAVGATARLLDVQLLPTDALPLPNLPSALAQVSVGEQAVRAATGPGGVACQATGTSGTRPPGSLPSLAYTTTAAYQTIPLFWTGAVMLFLGVILVAATPTRRAGGPRDTAST